jgi:hypothetical protein
LGVLVFALGAGTAQATETDILQKVRFEDHGTFERAIITLGQRRVPGDFAPTFSSSYRDGDSIARIQLPSTTQTTKTDGPGLSRAISRYYVVRSPGRTKSLFVDFHLTKAARAVKVYKLDNPARIVIDVTSGGKTLYPRPQGEVLSQVAQDEGYNTVNIIALNDDYGQGIADTFEQAFTDAGGEVGENVAYDPQGQSFDSEVQQASQGNPDAILLVAFPETGTSIIQAAQETGLVGEVPFLFTDGLADPEFPQDAGVDLEGEQGTRPASEGPGGETFASAYDEEYGEEVSTFSANTYDAVMLAALAAAAGGDTDGQTIQENMQDVSSGGEEVLPSDICSGLESAANGDDVNYEGAAGSQDFDDNGDVTSQYEFWQFGPEGQIERIELIAAPTGS